MVTEQRVRLKPLEPNTRYCVQVQVYIPMPHNNTGQYSKAACVMSTTNNTATAESLLPQPQNTHTHTHTHTIKSIAHSGCSFPPAVSQRHLDWYIHSWTILDEIFLPDQTEEPNTHVYRCRILI
ncbi:unnamed protein product [Oncorhynchus mykiss]|uniref:Interferon/interleukin receptor domain-containing protein n=1 Tax=Oncorhynchus mykiss TaxID=8022 RepID=A0A060YZ70_ONCMY|nr:unnamed protein product [Oncorhynchus mykiss]